MLIWHKNTYNDKGKSTERRRRKAMGLMLFSRKAMIAKLPKIATSLLSLTVVRFLLCGGFVMSVRGVFS